MDKLNDAVLSTNFLYFSVHVMEQQQPMIVLKYYFPENSYFKNYDTLPKVNDCLLHNCETFGPYIPEDLLLYIITK